MVVPNATIASAMPSGASPGFRMAVVVPFIVGIFGNLLALFILRRIRTSSNQKHGFMLRCLVTNDCIALTGMFFMFVVKTLWPHIKKDVWMCRFLVLWRFFGLSSGCVAMVMAVERWLALTKPFFYQRHISLRLLKRMIIILWLGVLCLVCAPFFGFGVYWDAQKQSCRRPRDAEEPLDVLYIYLLYSFGVFLCVAITYTNLAVMKALCMKDSPLNKHNMLLRRTSNGTSLACNAATREERSFGWLMFFLCVAFVLCWLPQLIAVPLTRIVANENKLKPLLYVADILLALHFALDPYLYVLHHWQLIKSIFLRPAHGDIHRNSSSATVSRSSSMRTSYDYAPSTQPRPV